MRRINIEIMRRLEIQVTPNGCDSATAVYQVKEHGKRKLSVDFHIDYACSYISIVLREDSFGYLESEAKEFAVAQIFVQLQLLKTLLEDVTRTEFTFQDQLMYGSMIVGYLSLVQIARIFIDRSFDPYYLYSQTCSARFGHFIWAKRMRDGGMDRFNKVHLFQYSPGTISQLIRRRTINR